MDFFGAESECDLQGGHLAYIDSAFTNTAVGKYARNISWDQYWIGATVTKQTMNDANVGIWTWIGTDRYVKFSDWYPGEPNSNNYCAVGKTSDFTWISTNCAVTRPFVCSIPVKMSSCDDGWVHFSQTKSCYKVFYNKNWEEAENVCRGESAHLTSIHSKDENDFITYLSKAGIGITNGQMTWIGLRTNAANTNDAQSYFWVDGSSVNYTNWAVNQPDNDQEPCGHIVSDDVTVNSNNFKIGDWNNEVCNVVNRNFICKKAENVIQI
uniref:C-type lectin domain-containing protein n=1 Tax=Panagrolaimus sp. JU765 TaxID=591449 RepID=A0AC34RLC9_9BILA